MKSAEEIVEAIAKASNWNERIGLIRKIPESFGTAQQPSIYASIAKHAYVPRIDSEFAYVHWRDEYELSNIESIYIIVKNRTNEFSDISVNNLSQIIFDHPGTLRIFRLIMGFTTQEFAEACSIHSISKGSKGVGKSTLKNMESGKPIKIEIALECAIVIDSIMSASLFPPKGSVGGLRSKLDKPDTSEGWESIRRFALHGVPLPVLLHQRAYGGAFRQLLDATSSSRGDLIEDPVEAIFRSEGIPYIRTGAHNQSAIESRFGLSVRPSPDFVVFDQRTGVLRAILECKGAQDGGTARDKAARFRALRAECQRLGGVPLFAVLSGVGWRRVADALGPVIRETDGRTFSPTTLVEMIETEPFPGLRNTAIDINKETRS